MALSMRRVGIASFMLVAAVATCADDAESVRDDGAGGGPGGGGGVGGGGGMPLVDCIDGDKLGSVDGADGLTTPGGLHYNVRVPGNYDPTRGHPLMVVYSPRVNDATAERLEAFTELTPDAQARGYIVAYAEWFDPIPLQNRADADTIRDAVAESWCIDPTRVYLTGHSDGGSIATLLALAGAPVAAIATSAAGFDMDDGPSIGCVGPFSAMIIHSSEDEIFPPPSFGPGFAAFWSECASCTGEGAPLADGCVPFSGCLDGAEVQYCETTGSHYDWYGLNTSMLDFFDRHALTAL